MMSMRFIRIFWCIVFVLGFGQCTCNPVATAANSDLLPFLRDDLAVNCCQCLATSTTQVPNSLFLCPETDAGLENGTTEDPEASALQVGCLCGSDAAECRQALNDGEELLLQGTCVQENGPCELECNGILAFPQP